MAKISVRKNGCLSFKPALKSARKLSHWLVTATIGEHNNVSITVPAPSIEHAGLAAGQIFEGTAAQTFSCRHNYQIQSIAQLI